jgi:hypothetical protein
MGELFATRTLEGWVGTKSLPAGLQRSSELLGLRQRLCARGSAPRFFLGERDVRRRDQPMKTVVLVFSLAPLFGANVSSTACGKLNAAGREITPEAQLYENAEPKGGYFFLPFRFSFFFAGFFAGLAFGQFVTLTGVTSWISAPFWATNSVGICSGSATVCSTLRVTVLR